ncbi:acyltransferase family protein [Uliginosibacterium sp. 31-16]|uniref:acyltransferase family protein n=1 Tax=Uliginosibacterium sp. 31-16 TaxID=3068315 RepID=UPI00273E696B|nr:acyltransferase family protein [Uliginosibacterium sp. 31-16]MDP5240053.1 acyltransferase family protein [Uliginosibacterium sp. 31-16]
MSPPPSTRNSVIDLLRAACVLYIVGFWHLMTYTEAFPGYHNGVTTRLTVAVLAVFMFVSGLCVAESFARSGPDARGFYRKRLLRVYPLFILACLLFLALKLANGAALLRALLLISPLWGKQPMTLWFIANLCLYYLLLPLLARQGVGSRRFWLMALGIEAVLCVAPLLSGTDNRGAIYFPAFCLGICFAGKAAPALGHWAVAALAALGVSLLAGGDPEQSLASIGLAMGVPVLVLFGTTRLLGHFSMPRLVHALAYAGFAAYLLHRVVFKLLMARLTPFAEETRLLCLLAVGVPLVFGLAWGIQRGYDYLLERRSR